MGNRGKLRDIMLRLVILLAIAILSWPTAALTQVSRTVPKEVVIYVHPEMPDIDFVSPLICELSRVLVAPVRAEKLDLPIDMSLMASLTELDSRKVLGRLYFATTRDPEIFMYLLVPHPLRLDNKATFATNFGLPYNKGVVSIFQLMPSRQSMTLAQIADVTMRRTYKIILRYVGQSAGLWQKNGCVLQLPRGIGELDGKSSDFCEEDRAYLVEAGVLKRQPGGGVCAPVSQRTGARTFEVVTR
jgi:predicted Zn-dependent protease